MGWVGQLSGLPWSQSPEGLVQVLERLACQPALRHQLSAEAGSAIARFLPVGCGSIICNGWAI